MWSHTLAPLSLDTFWCFFLFLIKTPGYISIETLQLKPTSEKKTYIVLICLHVVSIKSLSQHRNIPLAGNQCSKAAPSSHFCCSVTVFRPTNKSSSLWERYQKAHVSFFKQISSTILHCALFYRRTFTVINHKMTIQYICHPKLRKHAKLKYFGWSCSILLWNYIQGWNVFVCLFHVN